LTERTSTRANGSGTVAERAAALEGAARSPLTLAAAPSAVRAGRAARAAPAGPAIAPPRAAPGRAARRPRRPTPTRFYFSLRSPYSWLAYLDLRRDHPGLLDALEWRPFWEPDEAMGAALAAAGGSFPYSAMSRAKHLYVLLDVRRLAAARGLTVAWPVDRAPHWEVPHLAYLAAARHGRGREFVEAVYTARWSRGQDICDPATMAAIAVDLGLPPGELRDAAHDADLRAAGVAALLEVCRDGVFGVPFFVHGHDRFWGIDRVEAFAAALAADPPARLAGAGALAAAARLATAAAAGGDEGHAGGCG